MVRVQDPASLVIKYDSGDWDVLMNESKERTTVVQDLSFETSPAGILNATVDSFPFPETIEN